MNSFWLGRSVMVTGATGLMGSWLTPALVRDGAIVTALNLEQDPLLFPAGEDGFAAVQWLRGTITDADFLEAAFAHCRPEIVFHLAARSLVGAAESDPLATLETNVRGVWMLLDACRRYRVNAVLVASSGHVYKPEAPSPVDEDAPLGGELPYSASKNCAEIVTRMYACSLQVPAMVLRFSNVFGGGDYNFSRLVPGVIRAALRGERFLIRGDGRSARDLLYVEDGVNAFLRAAECLSDDASLAGQAFNIAQGVRWSTLEITETILALLDCSHLRPIVQNAVKRETSQQNLDISKAQNRLGWRPRVDTMEALRRTVEWYRQHTTDAEILHPRRALAAGGT